MPEPALRLRTTILASSPADLLPVGDLAGEDALELLEGQVVDLDVLGDDRAHAHDGDLVVDEVLDLVGLELGLGEDVGVTDGDGAGGDSGQALAEPLPEPEMETSGLASMNFSAAASTRAWNEEAPS